MSNETLVQDQNGTQTESAAENGTGPYYRPDVDVVERADELLIVADAPGLTADGISINFEQNSLTVHGKVARQAAEANYLVREYGTGDYYRVFRVSDRVDASRISATGSTRNAAWPSPCRSATSMPGPNPGPPARRAA